MRSMLSRAATVSASTKRRPAIIAGKIGTPATFLASVKCVPLQPVSAEVARRQALNTPHEVSQTFIDGSPDIKEGDILVIGAKEYPIKSVENWANNTTGHGAHLILVVEDLKR